MATLTDDLSNACPRCGEVSPARRPGGVCLRCFGQRALRFDPEESIAPRGVASADAEESEFPERIGPYDLLDEIGRGGMGVVFTARQAGLDRIVALKIVRGGFLASAEAEMRFEREAQTVARLRHANIVTVYDSGRAGGYAYLAMDLIEEGDLAQRMRQRVFRSAEAAELMRKLASAVGYAHREGILHRDLKPSNILLDNGEPRVADFGLAAPLAEGGDLTQGTSVLGTAQYLAPEAFTRGSAAMSTSSDIYALGAILYEMLAARAPFAGTPMAELPGAVATREPAAPRLLNPAVPRDLETICLKCLQKDPAKRYASADDLADDLQRFLNDEPIVARPISPPARFARWCRRRPAFAAAWFLLAALAIVAAASAIVIARERDRALASERNASDQLWRAELARAQALHGTKRPGQRFDAIAALTAAAHIRVAPELRDTAVAALAQTDIREVNRRALRPFVEGHLSHAPDVSTYIVETKPGVMEWRGSSDDAVRATLDGAAFGKLLHPPLFSPDGTRVLVRNADKAVRVWSLADARVIATMPDRPPLTKGTQAFEYNFAWNPAGTEFAVALPDGGATFHSAIDGTETRRWESPHRANVIRFSPAGDRIAIAERTPSKLWLLDAATLVPTAEITTLAGARTIAWHPQRPEFAVGFEDGKMWIINAADGAMLRESAGSRGRILQTTYSRAGDLIITQAMDATMRLIDSGTGEVVVTVPGAIGMPDMVFTPDDRHLISAYGQFDIVTWEIARSTVVHETPAQRVPDRAHTPSGVSFSRDGRLLAIGTFRGADILDGVTGAVLASFTYPPEVRDATSALFAPDNSAIYICSDEHGLSRRGLSWNENGTLRAGEPETVDAEAGFAIDDISADGSWLVLSSEKLSVAKVVERNGTLVQRLTGHPDVISSAISPDRRWVATQSAGQGPQAAKIGARIWSTADWKLARELDCGALGAVSFSGDGRFVAASGDKGFVVVPAGKWEPRSAMAPEFTTETATSSFSADGELLAASIGDRVVVANPATGKRLVTISSPATNPSDVDPRLSADGQRLAVLQADGTLDLWDLRELRAQLREPGLDW